MATNPHFDAVIVGGSFAGMAAALQLARTRRKVAVVDAGQRRNRFTHAAHGFLGQDGRPPGDIVADARGQLLAYPNVTWIEAAATQAARSETGFAVTIASGDVVESKTLILATGIVDEMLDIPGFQERWGKGIYSCPYCDGYELGGGRIGIIAVDEMSIHQAVLLREWGEVTFFLNDAFVLEEPHQATLAARGIAVEREAIEGITGDSPVVQLRGGRAVPVAGIFTRCRTHLASPVAEQLGCAIVEGPNGPYLQTNESKETSVPGVYGCGDAARVMHSVTFAVSDGAMAGISAHRALITW